MTFFMTVLHICVLHICASRIYEMHLCAVQLVNLDRQLQQVANIMLNCYLLVIVVVSFGYVFSTTGG